MQKAELDAIKRKVVKLMGLATSSNPEEADSALQMAKRLMEKHNIRTIDVDEETNTANVKHAVVDGLTKVKASWEVTLASAIAQCFDGTGVTEKTQTGWQVTFVASASELDIITDLHKRCRRAISKMARDFVAYNKHLGNASKVRTSYCWGMVDTIYKRLKAIYVDVPETRALVLVKQGAVQNRLKELFPHTRKVNGNTKLRSRDAYMQGLQDGHKVQLNKSVQGNGAQQLGATT